MVQGRFWGENFKSMSPNVPAVYEMCRIAHFTHIQDLASGVISLSYLK
jgi:hypothetical protein